MVAKVVKLAIPAVIGIASIRVYAASETKVDKLLSPKELSVYTRRPQQLYFEEEEPGTVQSGFSAVRSTVHPYFQAVQGSYAKVKRGTIHLYHAGEDIYHFLKEPSPGFLPRISIIAVSGLAGLVLARKGSRLKRLLTPLGLVTAGSAVCYPAETVGVLKVTGKNLYAATQWIRTSLGFLWKPSPPKDNTLVPLVSQKSTPALSEPGAQTAKFVPGAEPAESPKEELNSVPPEPGLYNMPQKDDQTRTPCTGPEAAVLPQPAKRIVLPSSALDLAARIASLDPFVPNNDLKTPKENSSSFADPKAMDNDQSDPEDADLYTTRS